MIKTFPYLIIVILFFSCGSLFAQTKQKNRSQSPQFKPRIIVLTDISTWEPDDHESLIRLLVHADLFEIEGIVVTTGWSMDNVNNQKHFMDIALGVIDAYEKDLPNLLKRSSTFCCIDQEPFTTSTIYHLRVFDLILWIFVMKITIL